MKAAELQKKEIKELDRMAHELRHKLNDMRFQLASHNLKNVKEMYQAKKDIARILTVIRQKTMPVGGRETLTKTN